MRISACVITKNEEKNLPLWLKSMEGIADELIVVDTGSEDGTVEVARKGGARVFFFQWIDDFAAAKNFAIEQATGDWILFLDADEYFEAEHGIEMRKTLAQYDKRQEVLGFVFPLVNLDRSTGSELGGTNHVIRCFRRSKDLRYVGRIHEEIRNFSGLPGRVMQYLPGIVIYHTGYSPELMEDKARRTITMLERSQRYDGPRDADDVYFMDCYYGMKDYDKAIAYARRAIQSGVSLLGMENRPYTVLICSMRDAGYPQQEIQEAIKEAMSRYPHMAEYRLLWGMYYWDCYDEESAEHEFRKGLELYHRRSENENPQVTDHTIALLPVTYFCLGKITYQRGEFQEAMDFLVESLRRNCYHTEALKILCCILEGKPKEESCALLESLYRTPKAMNFLDRTLKSLKTEGLQQIYVTVKRQKSMRISACVITKNEEKNLPLWLKSMEGIADELIVVDTGSEDGTVEVAKKGGARVFFFPWIDDFAAAKNFAIEQATGDWILFLDADEYFEEMARPKVRVILRKYNEAPEVLGLIFFRVNIDKRTGRDLGSSSYVVRAFRRDPSLRYVGRIHEELRNLPGAPGRSLQQVPEIRILHTGYSPMLMEEKLRQTIRILEISQKEDGARPADDVYFLDCYYGLGDYEKAIYYARRAIDAGVGLMGMMNRPRSLLIISLIRAGHPEEEIRKALSEAVEQYPNLAEYWMLWGEFDWNRGDYPSAAEHFRRGVELCGKRGEGDVMTTDHGEAFLPFARSCLEKMANSSRFDTKNNV